MQFDPDKHHRHTIRLKNYDYSGNGAYFVTLCTVDHGCLFDEFPLLREIIETCWLDISSRYEDVGLDDYVIMPNHFHGIIVFNSCQPDKQILKKTELGDVIGSFKSLCVNKWLKAIGSLDNNACGKFWQKNYYEHIVPRRCFEWVMLTAVGFA